MFGLNKKEEMKTDELNLVTPIIEDDFDDELGYQRIAKKIGKYEVYNPNQEEQGKLGELLAEIVEREKSTGTIIFSNEDVVSFYGLFTNIPMDLKRYEKLIKKPSAKFAIINMTLQEIIQEFLDEIEIVGKKLQGMSKDQKEKIINPILKQEQEKQALLDERRKFEEDRRLAEKQAIIDAKKAELLAQIKALEEGIIEDVYTVGLPDMTEADIIENYADSLPKDGE